MSAKWKEIRNRKLSPERRASVDAWVQSELSRTVTDTQIRQLRAEAVQAGDHEQVAICTVALGEGGCAYDPYLPLRFRFRADARAECARVIAETQANAEENAGG